MASAGLGCGKVGTITAMDPGRMFQEAENKWEVQSQREHSYHRKRLLG